MYINGAQQRLLYAKEAGDEGWHGTFAEIRYNVSRANPYITLDPSVARLEMIDVCGDPVQLNNPFAEYMQFGAGRSRNRWQNNGSLCGFWGNQIQAYTMNNVITYQDMSPGPKKIRIYATDAADEDGQHRVLIQGIDSSTNSPVYSQDGLNQVEGTFLTLASPFVDSPNTCARLTGIQKDVTANQVQIFEVDPVTGVETQIHFMGPYEKTASYRRYYLSGLPMNCCTNGAPSNPCVPPPPGMANVVQVTAMAKLELIPVRGDTDYCLLQNEEAIISECEAMRYEKMDNTSAASMADRKHKLAIRLLNGEMTHYYGQNDPAVVFAPFGSARLERLNLAMQ